MSGRMGSINALRAAVAFVERETRDRQVEGRQAVQKAVTDLVKRFRSDDPVQRAEQVRRFHHVLAPQVQDLVLDKLIADSLHGAASLKARSIRVLRQIGAQAVAHLLHRLVRSKKPGYRLRLLNCSPRSRPRPSSSTSSRWWNPSSRHLDARVRVSEQLPGDRWPLAPEVSHILRLRRLLD